jgi:hypothetical protein
MNEPSANALSTVTVVPLFNFHPAVRQLAEERLALAQPGWWRASAYFALGATALPTLFFLGQGYLTGRWDTAWIWLGAALVPLAAGLAWRAARVVTFDLGDRTVTTQRSMNPRSVTQRPLADLSAVQVMTYRWPWAVHQVRLVFAESEPRVVTLTTRLRHRKAVDLAQRLSDFLGVHLVKQKYGS